MAFNLFIFLRGEHKCPGARFEIAYRIVGGSIVCCADRDADPRQTLAKDAPASASFSPMPLFLPQKAVRELGMSII
jgi:hypothetical protein